MAKKKYGLTGTSSQFNIILQSANGSYRILEFKGGYSALDEYDLGKATRHAFWDGSKAKKMHHIEMEWVLIWDGVLHTEDGVKINDTKNFEFEEGRKIFLMPHADENISYEVLIIEDKRKLEKYRNIYSTSKSYTLAFENASQIIRYLWRDPSNKIYQTIDEMDFV